MWILLCAATAGCQGIPKNAFLLGPESIESRQLQTRRFDGLNESEALAAGASALQDLGFIITESQPTLGIVVGDKMRKAGCCGGFLPLARFLSSVTNHLYIPDRQQKFVASLVTRPVLDVQGKPITRAFFVRVTFSRTVWNIENKISTAEQIDDADLYQGFFERLSRSVALEAHWI